MAIKRLLVGLVIGSLSVLNSACSTTTPTVLPVKPDTDSAPKTVNTTAKEWVVATWNTEHLALPITDGCRPRTAQEHIKLKQYAQSLNADIIALQEVGSIAAVEAIFPKEDWQIIISERPALKVYTCRQNGAPSTPQKVAFAVRNHVNVVNAQSLDTLALQRESLRYGLELTVDSPLGQITLLNVHLKSGCFVDNYSRSTTKACETFAKQVPLIQKWINQKEQAGTPYMILGDFNHRLSAPYNHLTRQLAVNVDNSKSSLENLSANVLGCNPYYPASIDHILAGNLPEKGLSKAVTMHRFDDMAPKAMLSDHCALSVTLSEMTYPLSASVKWQTTSKEYRYLTSVIYQRATESLKNQTLPTTPWVVVMDVDETVLDNSQYQVLVESNGTGYTPETWDDWVASEQATLVPGVQGFIKTVFELGGKLALVTNRKRAQDHHTWNNLHAVNIPVSTDNTCLMGRVNADKLAVDGDKIINDKDLRRQQLEKGIASCYVAKNTRETLFSPLKILMQVGDNIEDFSGVTQEEVNIETLLPQSKTELILLPNPMYGSW